MLSREQLKHDRINLTRLVKRLEVISQENWEVVQPKSEEAWVEAQRIAQKIKYARQLFLNVDSCQDQGLPANQKKHMENLRETLNRVESVVDTLTQRQAPKPDSSLSYLSLVPMPTTVKEIPVLEPHAGDVPPVVDLPSSGKMPRECPPTPSPVDALQDLLPSPPVPVSHGSVRAQSISQPQGTPSLFSASLQTHEELSNELSRMATQLKRNAQHFSESLEKDKSLIQSASEVLEKNHDMMTKERRHLKDHAGKSSSTTWMLFGSLVAVTVAWVFMFFVIRIT